MAISIAVIAIVIVIASLRVFPKKDKTFIKEEIMIDKFSVSLE